MGKSIVDKIMNGSDVQLRKRGMIVLAISYGLILLRNISGFIAIFMFSPYLCVCVFGVGIYLFSKGCYVLPEQNENDLKSDQLTVSKIKKDVQNRKVRKHLILGIGMFMVCVLAPGIDGGGVCVNGFCIVLSCAGMVNWLKQKKTQGEDLLALSNKEFYVCYLSPSKKSVETHASQAAGDSITIRSYYLYFISSYGGNHPFAFEVRHTVDRNTYINTKREDRYYLILTREKDGEVRNIGAYCSNQYCLDDELKKIMDQEIMLDEETDIPENVKAEQMKTVMEERKRYLTRATVYSVILLIASIILIIVKEPVFAEIVKATDSIIGIYAWRSVLLIPCFAIVVVLLAIIFIQLRRINDIYKNVKAKDKLPMPAYLTVLLIVTFICGYIALLMWGRYYV